MKPDKILEKFRQHTQRWLNELDHHDELTFGKDLSPGWSLSQVVDHVCKTTHKCLDLAEQCSEGKGEKGRSGFGPALFSGMGAFPPVRIRVKKPPKEVEALYNPVNISLEQARVDLQKAEMRMEEMLQKIKTADRSIRLQHWAGGWFNGQQWYQNAEMHIKHHFRQLRRINKKLKTLDLGFK